ADRFRYGSTTAAPVMAAASTIAAFRTYGGRCTYGYTQSPTRKCPILYSQLAGGRIVARYGNIGTVAKNRAPLIIGCSFGNRSWPCRSSITSSKYSGCEKVLAAANG